MTRITSGLRDFGNEGHNSYLPFSALRLIHYAVHTVCTTLVITSISSIHKCCGHCLSPFLPIFTNTFANTPNKNMGIHEILTNTPQTPPWHVSAVAKVMFATDGSCSTSLTPYLTSNSIITFRDTTVQDIPFLHRPWRPTPLEGLCGVVNSPMPPLSQACLAYARRRALKDTQAGL